MFLSRGDRDLGVAFQTHPGRQAFISSGSKEARSALESRRVCLGAHWGAYLTRYWLPIRSTAPSRTRAFSRISTRPVCTEGAGSAAAKTANTIRAEGRAVVMGRGL